MEQTVDRLLTVTEVADRLRLDPTTVTRWFSDVPGVLDLAPPGLVQRKPKPGSQEKPKKQYRCLRVPESVLNGYLAKRKVA